MISEQQRWTFQLVRDLDAHPEPEAAIIALDGDGLLLTTIDEALAQAWPVLMTAHELSTMGLAHLDDGDLSIAACAVVALQLAERRKQAQARTATMAPSAA